MQFIQISQYNHETMQLAQPIYDRMRRIFSNGRLYHPSNDFNKIRKYGDLDPHG